MATEKQITYIKELLHQKRMPYWRKADAIRATTADLTSHDNRHAAADVRKCDLLVRAYEAIQTRRDLSEKEASALIDALKSTGDKLIEMALDRPQTAERIGLASFIAEHGAALEKALS
jgi:hypothetical protein